MTSHDTRADDELRWPRPLRCAQCEAEIPPDEALHPEAQDYTAAFCSPACHALWRDRHAEPVVDSHHQRRGS